MSVIDELDIYIPHAVIEIVHSFEAEIERLRADADRYRWLRDHAKATDMLSDRETLVYVWHGPHRTAGRTLDAAIDAAMKEAK